VLGALLRAARVIHLMEAVQELGQGRRDFNLHQLTGLAAGAHHGSRACK
jgi:hypothetical protein